MTGPDTGPEPVRIADAAWRHQPGLDALLTALGAADGEARFVGGAVRDTLLGLAVQDVDIATVHAPQTVLDRLKMAKIKAVPTGIEHGTVTAVLDGWPVEITTLRRDIGTDGRRATIAYTDDWREDAARRDFTFNALFADPMSGAVTDYFGGADDLVDGRVRFIGTATERIAEDHLRILRYFRFLARFGKGPPDAEAYAACIAQSNCLMALSRERIADEMMKLLTLPNPAEAVDLMVEGGVLRPVLPEIDAQGVIQLKNLIAREMAAGVAGSALRRLCALIPPDPAIRDSVAARLKLSNKARKRIGLTLNRPPPYAHASALAYWIGAESAIDRLLLDPQADLAQIATLAHWDKPSLPVSGGTLVAMGLPPGPDVARALRDIEAQWVAEDFPDKDRVAAIAYQIVSQFQRANQ